MNFTNSLNKGLCTNKYKGSGKIFRVTLTLEAQPVVGNIDMSEKSCIQPVTAIPNHITLAERNASTPEDFNQNILHATAANIFAKFDSDEPLFQGAEELKEGTLYVLHR